jgi:hypothetical protein
MGNEGEVMVPLGGKKLSEPCAMAKNGNQTGADQKHNQPLDDSSAA